MDVQVVDSLVQSADHLVGGDFHEGQALADAGSRITVSVLDAGCGSGENALHSVGPDASAMKPRDEPVGGEAE